jgi:mercuric ion binding protein
MKAQSTIFTLVFLFCSLFANAQQPAIKSEKIKVWGNCGMCQKHIEKAAKEAGAAKATWNKDTHVLAVKYDATKTTNKQIQEFVAKAGYDTKDFTGNNLAYEKLDECCKYDRKGAEKQ